MYASEGPSWEPVCWAWVTMDFCFSTMFLHKSMNDGPALGEAPVIESCELLFCTVVGGVTRPMDTHVDI